MQDSQHTRAKQSAKSSVEISNLQRKPQDVAEKFRLEEQPNRESGQDQSVGYCLPSNQRFNTDTPHPSESVYNDVIDEAIRSVTEQSFEGMRSLRNATQTNSAATTIMQPSSQRGTIHESGNESALILHQYYQQLEVERQGLPSSSESSHQRHQNHRRNMEQHAPTSLCLPISPSYFEQRLWEEVDRRRLPERSLLPMTSTPSTIRSQNEQQSSLEAHSLAGHRVSPTNTIAADIAGRIAPFAGRIAHQAIYQHSMHPPSMESLILPSRDSSVVLGRRLGAGNYSLVVGNSINSRVTPSAAVASEPHTTAAFQSIYIVSEAPPCREGPLPPYSERIVLPLGTQDDSTWCSDLNRFVRCEMVEVFRASGEDVVVRIHNKRIVYQQVGIRCRFCAHVPREDRVRRAAAFPSSMSRIQATVATMVREHFPTCKAIPSSVKMSLVTLQESSETPSICPRSCWVGSASSLGLVDTPEGIMHITDVQHRSASSQASPGSRELLVEDDDRALVPNFHFFLMSQAQRISVSASDVQNRLSQGISRGFGCRHCCHKNVKARQHRNRFFPPKRRFLHRDVDTFYEHLKECTKCPRDTKVSLSVLKRSAESQQKSAADQEKEKAFYSRIWTRLHGNLPIGVPAEYREHSDSVFSDA